MSKPSSPDIIKPVLEQLRQYMADFYPGKEFPLEFWKIEDDDLFFEALGYLPLYMTIVFGEDIPDLPEGYRLAYPIFMIEDDYYVNGWTALTNAGEYLLPAAIEAYTQIGMLSEAEALAAALQAIRDDLDDEDAAEKAYKSIDNPFIDDELRDEALLDFFRSRPNIFESDVAGT